MASKTHDKLLKQARDRFKLGYEADSAQRDADIQALRMYDLEQWPDAVLETRMAQQPSGNMPATPARPCLVIDKLREPVNQIVNQERESDLAVELIPADDFGSLSKPIDPAEIELREGLIRRIQRESESASARTWAFQRMAITGRGFYAIGTRFAKGKTFDQEVYCRRILNQGGIILDPAHEEPDGSDSEWEFLFTVMSYDAYKSEFPRAVDGPNKYLDCDSDDWKQLGQEAPGWFTQDGEQRYVRVAEYYYTEFSSRNLCEMPDGTTVWEDELPEGQEPIDKRAVTERTIKSCKIDGCQILEETVWPSSLMPIVKIVGNEIPPYDEKRKVDGIINKSAQSSQMGTNYMASKLAEEIGLSAVAPLMVEEGSIEGYEGWYNQANTRAFPYLPYKRQNLEGGQATPPYRPDKSVAVAPIAAGLQMFMEAIQTSTGVTDPQMGKPSRFSETWRGTQALINQSQRGTSNYMDNLTRSVRYEGRVMDSLLWSVYGRRPGRIARIVKGEGEAESIVIGAPFVMQANGQGNKTPVPAPQGATPQDEGVREYKLTKDANFNVAVKVTKGYDTRRQEEAAAMGEMVTQNPQMMQIIGDLFYRAQDWPGAKEAAERMKRTLAPPILAYLQEKEGGQAPVPPQVAQQMQQMQEQLQQTTQAAQQMQQDIAAKVSETQAKIQGEKEIALIKAESEQALANIKAMESIRIAEIRAGADLRKGQEKNESDLVKQGQEHQQALTELLVESELTPDPVQAEAQV